MVHLNIPLVENYSKNTQVYISYYQFYGKGLLPNVAIK